MNSVFNESLVTKIQSQSVFILLLTNKEFNPDHPYFNELDYLFNQTLTRSSHHNQSLKKEFFQIQGMSFNYQFLVLKNYNFDEFNESINTFINKKPIEKKIYFIYSQEDDSEISRFLKGNHKEISYEKVLF